ncbi:MAG: phage tail protein [Gemmatimonadota bacterium]
MGFWLIALIVVAIVLFVAAILLAPKPKFEDARPRGLGDFQFPTATETRAVPILWGTVDIKGPNVIWYGDLKIIKIKKKVKSGFFKKTKITVGFRYFIGMDLAMAYGPLDRITRLEISSKVAFSGSLDVKAAGNAGASLAINQPNLLGGKEKGGGVVGTFKIYAGLPDQVQDPYLQLAKNLGPDIPAYVDIAHAVWQQGEIGENTRIDPYIFRVTRFPNNLGLAGDGHIVRGTIDNGDANPAEVISEIMTDERWGLNLDVSKLDLPSFIAAGNTLATEGNGFSLISDQVTRAEDILKEVLRQIDAALYEESNGVFTLKLIRDDFVFATLPTFDESNILELTAFSRGSWSQTANHVNIGYQDRNKDFQETGAMAQDIANVRVQGKQVRVDFQYPGVKHSITARDIATRELRVNSFPLAKITLTTNRDGQSLRPGDVLRFSWAKLGITDMVVRVMSIDLGDLLDGKVKLQGMQDVFRLAEAIYKDPNDSDWVPIANTAAAFVDELVRATPRILMNTNLEEIPNPELERITSVAKRPNGQVVDFEVFVDEGSGAGFVGEVAGSDGLTPFATLVNDYPKATLDVEASDLLLLDDEEEFVDLSDEVASELRTGAVNLVLIQGATEAEDEIIGWEELVDNGNGTFTLRRVHRGLLDTQARAHSAGAKAWFFTEGSALSDSTYGPTQAITVKHQSQTTTDDLAITSAAALPLTFDKRTTRPHHPANWLVDGTRLPLAVDETADLLFAWAHRTNDEVEVLDADVASPNAQDTEVEYDLEFRHAVTQAVLRSLTTLSTSPPPTNSTWLSFNYTAANLQADTGEVGDFPLEARIKARYSASATVNEANLESFQQLVDQFNVDMGGATVQSIDLDGTTEFLARTANVVLGAGNAWSLNVWTRGSSNAGGTQMFVFIADPTGVGNANRIELSLTDDSNGSAYNVRLFDSAGTLFKDYDFGSYTVSTYIMLTITWDGTNLTVYQGSSPQTPTLNLDNAGTMTNTGRQVLVGATDAPAASWAGLIFSPKMWGVELTGTEVGVVNAGLSTFNSRADGGGYASRDDLIHLWDFRTSADIGQDYGHQASNLIDIDTDAANIDATDLSATVP